MQLELNLIFICFKHAFLLWYYVSGSESVWPGLGGWDLPNPIDLSVGLSLGNQSFFFGGMFYKNDLKRNASGYFIGWSTVKEPIKHDLMNRGKGKINFY
jgi:hypothetical protein